jgi:LacI family transcriptional regulator
LTTISRALSGQAKRYRIRPETEARIRACAAELGFTPNQLARGLRLNKTAAIGLIIPDVSNPFFASIARQVALEVRRHGYSLVLCDSQDSADMEAESLEILRSRSVDGLLLCPAGQSREHLVQFERGTLPIILMDRYFPDLKLPYVASDNVKGAKEATSYLIQNGHRRIACLQGLRGTSPNDDRLRGYKKAFSEQRVACDQSLILGHSFSEQDGYIETKLLLSKRRDVTAIFSFSSVTTLGAMRALAEAKLRVPDDVSLLSFDEQPYSAYLATPLTTVAQQYAEMGSIAVKLLLDWLQPPHRVPDARMLLPTTLIQRASVKKIGAAN